MKSEGENMIRKRTLLGSLAALLALALGVSVLLALLSPTLERDPPRDLPWTMPDYRLAETSWTVDDDGRIHTHVEHLFLPDITPAMIAWFYQYLPIATVALNGETMPLYHIFHPTEHGTLRVLAPAPDGTAGMARGAVIQRDEWFGPYDSRGAARIVEFTDRGMLAIPEALGLLDIGSVRHIYSAAEGGSNYRVETVIGSDLPVVGPLINRYLRSRVFHPAMLEQWQRHQVQEVSSLRFYLPELYAQRDAGRHFVLNIQPRSSTAPEQRLRRD
jgi:hypothetical protein